MSRLAQEMGKLAYGAGGSHKTLHDRQRMTQRFARHLLAQNIQVSKVSQLKAKHIESYIQARKGEGITLRTLQNEMAMVRTVLSAAGRHQLAQSERLANRTLGIGGASRDGSHKAVPQALYLQVLDKIQHKDVGLACAMKLSRMMGLRAQEAVQCCQSLKTWNRMLNKGAERLPVIYGTKGGRPRTTLVLNREAVRLVVEEALVVSAARSGRLIDKPELRSAMNYWHNHLCHAGLKGEYAPHSLRYAWAQEAVRCYREKELSQKEALAVTSMDLGHGDGRGRYVERVYARN